MIFAHFTILSTVRSGLLLSRATLTSFGCLAALLTTILVSSKSDMHLPALKKSSSISIICHIRFAQVRRASCTSYMTFCHVPPRMETRDLGNERVLMISGSVSTYTEWLMNPSLISSSVIPSICSKSASLATR